MLSWLKAGARTKGPPSAPAEQPTFQEDSFSALTDGARYAALGRNRRVMVVDDDEVVLKAFELKLQASGFTVFTVRDAATVTGAAQKLKPELILLDINFPATDTAMEWSGLTAIQWLRRFPELATIPVIIISGTDGAAWKEKALAVGAKAFFHKPVVFKELLDTMLESLSTPRSKRPQTP